ncbi:MAG: hypothetical protein JW938_05915 [Candidatus Omnitrophica bacterium]|nr:hypothetical protein [Candidatus Omnitrophota bacterium]
MFFLRSAVVYFLAFFLLWSNMPQAFSASQSSTLNVYLNPQELNIDDLRAQIKDANFNASSKLDTLLSKQGRYISSLKMNKAFSDAQDLLHKAMRAYKSYRELTTDPYDSYLHAFYILNTQLTILEDILLILREQKGRVKKWDKHKERWLAIYEKYAFDPQKAFYIKQMYYLLSSRSVNLCYIKRNKRLSVFNRMQRIMEIMLDILEKEPGKIKSNSDAYTSLMDYMFVFHTTFGVIEDYQFIARQENLMKILSRWMAILEKHKYFQESRAIQERYSVYFLPVYGKQIFKDIDYIIGETPVIKKGFELIQKKKDTKRVKETDVNKLVEDLTDFVEKLQPMQERDVWSYVTILFNFCIVEYMEYARTSSQVSEKKYYYDRALGLLKWNIIKYVLYKEQSHACGQLPWILRNYNYFFYSYIMDPQKIDILSFQDEEELKMVMEWLSLEWSILKNSYTRIEQGEIRFNRPQLDAELFNFMKVAIRVALRCNDKQNYVGGLEFIMLAYQVIAQYEDVISVETLRNFKEKNDPKSRIETGRFRTVFHKILKGLQQQGNNAKVVEVMSALRNDNNTVSNYLKDYFPIVEQREESSEEILHLIAA